MGNVARALIACSLCALPACADNDSPSDDASPVGAWVGTVEGTDAAVAAMSSDESATVFFCGGPSTLDEDTHWFAGLSPLQGKFSAISAAFEIDGTAQTESISGLFETPEGVATFSARRAVTGTLAGLYDAAAPCGHVGLIVLQNSARETPTAQGTCLRMVDGQAVVEQVNPVMPLARDAAGGIAVTVASAPEQSITVHPLVPGG